MVPLQQLIIEDRGIVHPVGVGVGEPCAIFCFRSKHVGGSEDHII